MLLIDVDNRKEAEAFIAQDPFSAVGLFDRVEITRWKKSFRSEEHTSELQSLMRISYAVFCLKKKNNRQKYEQKTQRTQISKKCKPLIDMIQKKTKSTIE